MDIGPLFIRLQTWLLGSLSNCEEFNSLVVSVAPFNLLSELSISLASRLGPIFPPQFPHLHGVMVPSCQRVIRTPCRTEKAIKAGKSGLGSIPGRVLSPVVSRCKHELKYGLGEESLSLLGICRVDMCSKVEKVDNCENRIPSDMIWTCEGSGPPGASSLEAFPLQMTMNI